jgi:hypothetical protein
MEQELLEQIKNYHPHLLKQPVLKQPE